jgi:hypothetical protein
MNRLSYNDSFGCLDALIKEGNDDSIGCDKLPTNVGSGRSPADEVSMIHLDIAAASIHRERGSIIFLHWLTNMGRSFSIIA